MHLPPAARAPLFVTAVRGSSSQHLQSHVKNSVTVQGSVCTAESFIQIDLRMKKLQVPFTTVVNRLVVSINCKCNDQHTRSAFTLPTADTGTVCPYRGTGQRASGNVTLHPQSTDCWCNALQAPVKKQNKCTFFFLPEYMCL